MAGLKTQEIAGIKTDSMGADFSKRVVANQKNLALALKTQYDFIICGSGSSGSVVARRLAENPNVSVLLLEAGGWDELPSVIDPNQWVANLFGDLVWQFQTEPHPNLHGRPLPYAMGKILGGGSGVNVSLWARGHKADWDFFAKETGDQAWNYESVLGLYRRIEDWQGKPNPQYHGTGGLVYVAPGSDLKHTSSPSPSPTAPAFLKAAASFGIPTFDTQNGILMESEAGASFTDLTVRDGKTTVDLSVVYLSLDGSTESDGADESTCYPDYYFRKGSDGGGVYL